ncbi:uncharacterized protein LOC110850523 [Folsomia candida]|uniref:uncharacterized protein LOC110850523 n=1 Tax=Folsomia candida TaxID=158441 RepID=UPI000B8FA917|nr:uncharacterized protein LOC110850523 [Folsomia candida]
MHKAVLAAIYINVTLQDTKGNDKTLNILSPFQRYGHQDLILSRILAAGDYLTTSLSLYGTEGSGWKLHSINHVNLKIGKYTIFSARGWIQHPKELGKKIINIHTKGNENCFQLSLMCGLKRHLLIPPKLQMIMRQPGRILNKNEKLQLKRYWEKPKSYEAILAKNEKTGEINFTGMKGATALSQMDAFEAENPLHSVTIFGYEEKLFVIRPAPKIRENHVDLLLLRLAKPGSVCLKKEDVEYDYHFCTIPSLSKFVGKSGYRRSEVCEYCFGIYKTSIEKHAQKCAIAHRDQNQSKQMKFPEDDVYEFKNLRMIEDLPIKIFFKFLWYNENDRPSIPTCNQNLKFTTPVSNIKIKAYFLCVINQFNQLDDMLIYDGENPVEHFIQKVIDLKFYYKEYLKRAYVPISLTPNDNLRLMLATRCEICGTKFNEENKKCSDHNHWTGQLRYVACSNCNILIQVNPTPILLGHNINNYECHFLLKSFNKRYAKNIKVIMRVSESIISIKFNGIRCLDKRTLLDHDLYDLVDRHKRGIVLDHLPYRFPCLYGALRSTEVEEMYFSQFLFRIAMPSRAINQQVPNGFPKYELFKDPVTSECPPETEYQMAGAVFWNFRMENAKDLLYYGLKTQVLLTADIFLDFNKMAMKHFKLSVFHSYSLSGYSFNACFFDTKASLEYIKDPEIITYLKNAIRGGPTESVTRKVVANSERLNNFNPCQPRSNILIIDENSQYPSKMKNKMAVGSYSFLSQDDLSKFDLMTDCNGDWNYIVTVQISHPTNLHVRQSPMPPCPYQRELKFTDLSPTQQLYSTGLNGEDQAALFGKKLVAGLYDKTYTCCLEAVQYFLESGLRVTNLSKCLKFRQAAILEPSVDKLSELRRKAILEGDEVGSLLFKGIINRVFDFTILNGLEGVCLFRMKRTAAMYKYPMIMSIQTLDRAKISLYKMWDLIRSEFGIENTKLSFYDTDCLLRISTADHITDPKNQFYKILSRMQDHLDFSSLPKFHPLYSDRNASLGGKWKIVTLDAASVISLRVKCYSIRLGRCAYCSTVFDPRSNCNLVKKGSGIPRSTVKNELDHQMYEDALIREGALTLQSYVMESKNHSLCVVSREYKFHSLNPRRYLLPNMIDTLAFGDVRIPTTENVQAIME